MLHQCVLVKKERYIQTKHSSFLVIVEFQLDRAGNSFFFFLNISALTNWLVNKCFCIFELANKFIDENQSCIYYYFNI